MLSILHVMPGSDCSLVERQVIHGWSFLFDVFASRGLVVPRVPGHVLVYTYMVVTAMRAIGGKCYACLSYRYCPNNIKGLYGLTCDVDVE